MIEAYRHHRVTVEQLPRMLGWKVRLEFDGTDILFPDHTVDKVPAATFDWERTNIDAAWMLAWYHVATGDVRAMLTHSTAQMTRAFREGNVVLVNQPVRI